MSGGSSLIHVPASALYVPGTRGEINDLLDELRALFFEAEPGFGAWLQLCNLLERLRAVGGLELGVAYALGHGVERWPRRERPAPWCWAAEPALLALTGREARRSWVPVHCLFEGGGAAWLSATLPNLETTARARRLEEADLELFVKWVTRLWRFCRSDDVPPHEIELRVDAGVVGFTGITRPQTTILELQGGLGVVLYRGWGSKMGVQPGARGVRYARWRKKDLVGLSD